MKKAHYKTLQNMLGKTKAQNQRDMFLPLF